MAPYWKVKPGAVLAHEGRALRAGTVVELPRRIAVEVSHLVDECDAAGTVTPSPQPAWTQALETIQRHESVDVLRAERERLVALIGDLRGSAEEAQAESRVASERLSTAVHDLEALDLRITEEIDHAARVHQDRLAEESAPEPPAERVRASRR